MPGQELLSWWPVAGSTTAWWYWAEVFGPALPVGPVTETVVTNSVPCSGPKKLGVVPVPQLS
ncbi:hypothetical protein [Streptomyces sp. PanSC19]|uniref:hypothetical protein n=1 Tax=Streptomyces sp. PanSC19 TaxID=1520455 RepID=UPI0016139435|nr:hypothetical protein [Streptomyces sp. PanSC19]